jgi:uncharacterized protein (TIGR00730 family)
MGIKAMAVFCGSKCGENPLFEAETTQLGYLLAEKGIQLIYGGGNKGLMGAVANAVLEKNGTVTGIIPTLLSSLEHQHNGLTELLVVDTMHTRKLMLYEKCDAAIILPGGYGTLDEVFEMLTWNQLNIHNKPIFILNICGFYDNLIAHIIRMHEEKILYAHPDEKITVLERALDLTHYLS